MGTWRNLGKVNRKGVQKHRMAGPQPPIALPGWRAKKRRSAPPVRTVKSNAVSFTFFFRFRKILFFLGGGGGYFYWKFYPSIFIEKLTKRQNCSAIRFWKCILPLKIFVIWHYYLEDWNKFLWTYLTPVVVIFWSEPFTLWGYGVKSHNLLFLAPQQICTPSRDRFLSSCLYGVGGGVL